VKGSPESAPPLQTAAEYESVPCILCGGDGFKVILPSRREPGQPIDLEKVFRSSGDEPQQDQIVQCTVCGLVYVRPRIRSKLVLEGYKSGIDKDFVSQLAFRERTFTRCQDRIEAVAKPPGKRILDVGAAGGSFLHVAQQRGYEPFGCEPNNWMCRFARDHYGLTLHSGTLFDMPVAEGSIDLLTLWDVLEHTPDPKEVLARAHALLADGGILALTYPDFGSLPARLLGRRWPFLLTVHLYYFVRATMRDLLRRTCFQPLSFRPHIQTLEMGYASRRAAPYLRPFGSLLIRSVHLLGLDQLPLHYWVGQTMVVATKSS